MDAGGAQAGNGLLGWSIVAVGWGLPLLHVALSRHAGSWRTAPGQACPFGARAAWAVMILLLGPLGYLLFWKRLLKVREEKPAEHTLGPSPGPGDDLRSRLCGPPSPAQGREVSRGCGRGAGGEGLL